jgi:hypothetical protein
LPPEFLSLATHHFDLKSCLSDFSAFGERWNFMRKLLPFRGIADRQSHKVHFPAKMENEKAKIAYSLLGYSRDLIAVIMDSDPDVGNRIRMQIRGRKMDILS